jgi:hypothetical protein
MHKGILSNNQIDNHLLSYQLCYKVFKNIKIKITIFSFNLKKKYISVLRLITYFDANWVI